MERNPCWAPEESSSMFGPRAPIIAETPRFSDANIPFANQTAMGHHLLKNSRTQTDSRSLAFLSIATKISRFGGALQSTIVRDLSDQISLQFCPATAETRVTWCTQCWGASTWCNSKWPFRNLSFLETQDWQCMSNSQRMHTNSLQNL